METVKYHQVKKNLNNVRMILEVNRIGGSHRQWELGWFKATAGGGNNSMLVIIIQYNILLPDNTVKPNKEVVSYFLTWPK